MLVAQDRDLSLSAADASSQVVHDALLEISQQARHRVEVLVFELLSAPFVAHLRAFGEGVGRLLHAGDETVIFLGHEAADLPGYLALTDELRQDRGDRVETACRGRLLGCSIHKAIPPDGLCAQCGEVRKEYRKQVHILS